MTFTITELTRCAGQNHYHFTVQVGETSRNLTLTKSDLDLDTDDLETHFIARVRSAIKESGAATFAQARTALINKEFKL